MKSKQQFIVTEDGATCAFTRFPDMFGSEMVPKRGLLWKTTGSPTVFAGEKSALLACGRAAKLANKLRTTMVSEWDKAKPFINRGEFRVIPYNQ